MRERLLIRTTSPCSSESLETSDSSAVLNLEFTADIDKGCTEQVPEAALPVDGDQVNHFFVISDDVLSPFSKHIY